MKQISYFSFFIGLAMLTACGGQEPTKSTDPEGDPQVKTAADGTGRLQSSHVNDTVNWRGAKYKYDIKRVPDDSIPAVKDENGHKFADNRIELTIDRNGERFFSRTFTKRSFAEYIGDDFLKNGILEGLVFDKAEPDGLHFAASVSYPQSDMFIPLIVTVASNGGLSISKDTVLDSAPDDAEEATDKNDKSKEE